MQPRIFLIWTTMLAMAAGHCVGQTAAPADRQRQAALALEQQGENAGAEAAWRMYLNAHPSSAEAYAHLGLLEARQERYKEAVPFYRKALVLDPKISGLRLNLGLALFKAAEMKDALQEFKPLLKSAPPSSPDRQRLTILIGMCYYGTEEYALAAPYLKQAAAGDPRNLPLRLALAHSCLWSKQYAMRSGHLSRDPDAERRVGRGRYAGRRSAGRDERRKRRNCAVPRRRQGRSPRCPTFISAWATCLWTQSIDMKRL
jgi:tetratricopeptide (TPR) repeat protein